MRADKKPRRLIWAPIVHGQVDLGSAGESVRAIYTRRIGNKEWDRHVEAIEELWRAVRKAVECLRLDYHVVKLYQDGLPNCGREMEIVSDLAKAGSPNHQLLLDLIAKGAKLYGTESPKLLMEEYELSQCVLRALTSDELGGLNEVYVSRGKALLEKRDRYIAERINRTLNEGEIGLVFLGLLHSPTPFLARDIEVITLGKVAGGNQ